MKERPILFSTPMVRAVIDDRKDITRRITEGLKRVNESPDDWELHGSNSGETGIVFNYPNPGDWSACFRNKKTDEILYVKSPYGGSGDVLWCRETFGELYDTCDHPEIPGCPTERWSLGYVYKADGYNHKGSDGFWDGWKPSIHMPKEACRLKLEVLSIRPERLHDITEEDAIREGVIKVPIDDSANGFLWKVTGGGVGSLHSAKMCFEKLWESINGPGSWNPNLWVWRIEFKKLQP